MSLILLPKVSPRLGSILIKKLSIAHLNSFAVAKYLLFLTCSTLVFLAASLERPEREVGIYAFLAVLSAVLTMISGIVAVVVF